MIILNDKDLIYIISDMLLSAQSLEASVKALKIFVEEGKVVADDRLTRLEERVKLLEKSEHR